jgi:hypothetical protein
MCVYISFPPLLFEYPFFWWGANFLIRYFFPFDTSDYLVLFACLFDL